MTGAELERYIREQYGITPEYPFARYPDVAIYRHGGNKKWFAAFMTVSGKKLGLSHDGILPIVNLKVAEEIRDSFLDGKTVFPGYHMNKKHWISVILDGSVSEDTLTFLLGVSYDLTK